MNIRQMPRSFAAGLVNISTFINFYNGKNSLGDRVVGRMVSEIGEPISYITGMACAVAAEIFVPVYIAQTTGARWYQVLLADALVKLAPRGIENFIKREREILRKPSIARQL